MWERFTEHAKNVIAMAREEATRLSSENVRPEHLLLAFRSEPSCIAVCALNNLGVDMGALAEKIEQQVENENATLSSSELSFTQGAKKVLEMSVEEARRFNHSYIGTEHMLLGLIKEGESLAARILQESRIDFGSAEGEIIRLLT